MKTDTIKILWDIETGPLPDKELQRLQRATSKEFPKDKLALSAQTGQILAIGLWQDGHRSPVIFSADVQSEKEIIERFMWQICGAIAHTQGTPVLVGFNTLAFDVPFLLQRMWAHGMNWEEDFPLFARYRQFDLMEQWRLPARVGEMTDRISLAGLAAHLNVNSYKTGRGEAFATLLETDPEAAKRYLINDLKLLAHCAPRMVGYLKDCFRNIIEETEE
jgi:hypothetical protein